MLLDSSGPLRKALNQALSVLLPFELVTLPNDRSETAEDLIRILTRNRKRLLAVILNATATLGGNDRALPIRGLDLLRRIAKANLYDSFKVIIITSEPEKILRRQEAWFPSDGFLRDTGCTLLSPPLNVIQLLQTILEARHGKAF